MDYSQLSDFEINKRVGIALGKEFMPDDCQDFGLSVFPEVMLRNGDVKDYCNEPNDAWPIIESNNISINHDALVKEWIASHGGIIYQHCRGKRPLRLAMECFVKIQDANHA